MTRPCGFFVHHVQSHNNVWPVVNRMIQCYMSTLSLASWSERGGVIDVPGINIFAFHQNNQTPRCIRLLATQRQCWNYLLAIQPLQPLQPQSVLYMPIRSIKRVDKVATTYESSAFPTLDSYHATTMQM